MNAAYPHIFTFYSYKGGVGRSMALLNCAYQLAAWGRHVLVLDLDLEAPGLSGWLRRNGELVGERRDDMVDLVAWALAHADEGADAERAAAFVATCAPLSDDLVTTVKPESIAAIPGHSVFPGRLDVITCHEDLQRDFAGRVDALALSTRDARDIGRASRLLGAWARAQRVDFEVPEYWGPDAPTSAPYDYVLVDSRTGLTDIGGLCIGPLCNSLVVVCGLNDQNIEGTRSFLQLIGYPMPGEETERKAPKPMMLVASPVPVGERARRSDRLDEMSAKIGPAAQMLTYYPPLALYEAVMVRDEPDELTASQYVNLTRTLLAYAHDGPPRDLAITSDAVAQTELYERLARSAAVEPALVSALPALASRTQPASDEVRRLMDAALRAAGDDATVALMDARGRLLTSWAEATTDTRLAHARREEAVSCFGAVAEPGPRSLRALDPERRTIHDALAEALEPTRHEWPALRTAALLERGRLHRAEGRHDMVSADCDAVLASPAATPGQRATALITRGLAAGEQGDSEREIADYTAAIDLRHIPAEQRAKALLNRGITYGQRGSEGDVEREIADYAAVIDLPDAPAEQCARALINRGLAFGQRGSEGDMEREIADYAAVIDLPDAVGEVRARALVCRGLTYYERGGEGDTVRAIADYSAVIDMPDAPATARASALRGRGLTYYKRGGEGDTDRAIADYSAVVGMPDAPATVRAWALVRRSLTYVERGNDGDTSRAMSDWSVVIRMPDAPAERRAWALLLRGAAYNVLDGEAAVDPAIADYTAVINMPDVPAQHRAMALSHRGAAYSERGEKDDVARAISDYTAVIDMPDAPVEQRTTALFNRGLCYSERGEEGDVGRAIADYTAVIEMPDAPAEHRAKALVNRGVCYSQRGEASDVERALSDYSAVVAMPDAPARSHALALVNRGIRYGQRRAEGDADRAIADCSAVVAMPDAPAEQRGKALYNLACLDAARADATKALAHLADGHQLDALTQHRLDTDPDFDPIRADPAFVAFRDSLPPGDATADAAPAAPDPS